MIKRYYQNLDSHLKPNKVLVIYGPRRVGKTTLLSQYLAKTKFRYKLVSGDNIEVQDILSSQDFTRILEFVEGYDLIAIDEAQNIPHVGMGLKIIADQAPGIYVIATGSSSFELSGQLGEPLTGRKQTLNLYPLAQLELLEHHNKSTYELKGRLADYLVFGSYPDVVTARSRREKMNVLEELVNASLLKDVLSLEKVKGSKVLLNLLRLLAFQVGSEVSLNEMAGQLRLDVKTVDRYLDLLEKTFVIVSLGGYSRNLRKEITKKYKYFFLDNGVRNAVIAQFNKLELRNDTGQLWENFIVTERLKKQHYHRLYTNNYFWRTYDQQEIDWVEEREGKLCGYEIKWQGKKIKAPKSWQTAYPKARFEIISQDNYLNFIM